MSEVYNNPQPAMIMVVDDDAVIRLMLQKLLEEQGHHIIIAENGRQAVELFEEHQPELVLMDAAMPLLDGFNACAQIKQTPHGKDTPVMMITALYDDNSVDQAFAAGAMEYITKPIHLAALRHRVGTLLKARRAELAIARSEARFRGVFEQAAMGIALVDHAGKILDANPALAKMLARPVGQLCGTDFSALFKPEGSTIEREFHVQLLTGKRSGYRMEKHFFPQADSPMHWADLTTSLVTDDVGEPRFFVYMVEDVTIRKQAQLKHRIAMKVFENTNDSVMITDPHGRIAYVNHAFTLVTGYTYEEVLDKTPAFLRSGEHTEAFYQEMWETLADNGHWRGEIRNRRRNGDLYSEWLSISAVRGDHNEVTHYVAVYSDIAALPQGDETLKRLTQYDARIYHLTRYDPLTELPNRLLFHERLTHACRDGEQVALLCIDLADFGAINTELGYGQGDTVLKEVAHRLQQCARDRDAVARLENDEFAMIIAPLSQPYDARLMADKVFAALARPIDADDREIRVDCHIGAGFYTDDNPASPEEAGRQVEYLFQRAELAMYLAREEGGRNVYRVYAEGESGEKA